MSDRVHLITFIGALAVCIAVVAWMVGPYLLSLYLGAMLAMLSYPVYQRLRGRHWGSRAAASAVTALVLAVVIVPLAGMAILAVTQGLTIAQQFVELKEFPPRALSESLSRLRLLGPLVGDADLVDARLRGGLQSAGHYARAGVLELAKGVPDFLLQLALALVAFFFFLADGRRFKDWVLGFGVLDRDVQEELVESLRESTESAVLAGLAAAVSQAALITVAFLLLGIPGAFLAGGLTFVFAWIPLVGTAPATLAGMGYLCLQGSAAKLGGMAVLGLLASVVDSFVRPLVLRGRSGMHPLIGFVAIVSGIRMFGILGVFIGPMLAAMLVSLLKFWPAVRGKA